MHRDERRDFIRAKYEQHKYAIITCTDKEDLKQDLKQAVLAKDLLSLLQVYAEGLDLATTLPDMVRTGPQWSDVVSLSLAMALPCNYIVSLSLARTLNYVVSLSLAMTINCVVSLSLTRTLPCNYVVSFSLAMTLSCNVLLASVWL